MKGESEVPGGTLNLISTKYPDHGHHGHLPLSRKNAHGRAGNRTRDLMVSSQELWPPSHKAGPNCVYQVGLICVGLFNAAYRTCGYVHRLVHNSNGIFLIISGELYRGTVEERNLNWAYVHMKREAFCLNFYRRNAICVIYGISPYRAVNTFLYGYKNQSLNEV